MTIFHRQYLLIGTISALQLCETVAFLSPLIDSALVDLPLVDTLSTSSADGILDRVSKTNVDGDVEEVSSVEVIANKKNVPRHAKAHKKWGVDSKGAEDEYWFDQRIHTLGNIGIGGGLHACIAPFATKQIDDLAYGGVDLRLQVANELSQMVETQKARVLDMCCGVGMSTRALWQAFPDAQNIMGLDTSPQMVAMAEFVTEHIKTVTPWMEGFRNALGRFYESSRKRGQDWLNGQQSKTCAMFHGVNFIKANAQDTKLPSKSFDLITIMYAFHEAPHHGRFNIIEEARRLLSPGGVLAIVDIAADYKPSPSMLAGEPYVLEYQQNIHDQLKSIKGLSFQGYKTMIPGHVGMWTLRRQSV